MMEAVIYDATAMDKTEKFYNVPPLKRFNIPSICFD